MNKFYLMSEIKQISNNYYIEEKHISLYETFKVCFIDIKYAGDFKYGLRIE